MEMSKVIFSRDPYQSHRTTFLSTMRSVHVKHSLQHLHSINANTICVTERNKNPRRRGEFPHQTKQFVAVSQGQCFCFLSDHWTRTIFQVISSCDLAKSRRTTYLSKTRSVHVKHGLDRLDATNENTVCVTERNKHPRKRGSSRTEQSSVSLSASTISVQLAQSTRVRPQKRSPRTGRIVSATPACADHTHARARVRTRSYAREHTHTRERAALDSTRAVRRKVHFTPSTQRRVWWWGYHTRATRSVSRLSLTVLASDGDVQRLPGWLGSWLLNVPETSTLCFRPADLP